MRVAFYRPSTFSMLLLVLAIAPTATADEAEAIKKFVFEAQRAGFERGDLEAYMKQWAKDARIVMGRGEKPGKYDVVIKRPQIEATRRIRFTALPDEERIRAQPCNGEEERCDWRKASMQKRLPRLFSS